MVVFSTSKNIRSGHLGNELFLVIFINSNAFLLRFSSPSKRDKPTLIYTAAQGSPFRCKEQSVINGSPEHDNVLTPQYTYKHYTGTDTGTDNNIDGKLSTNKNMNAIKIVR